MYRVKEFFCPWGSVHHHSWVAPVELLASDGQGSSHALEDVAHGLVSLLNRGLVLSFSLVDGIGDTWAVSC